MLNACEIELAKLEMAINPAKLVCIRIAPIGKRHQLNISTDDGTQMAWQQSCRYLGIQVVAGVCFHVRLTMETLL